MIPGNLLDVFGALTVGMLAITLTTAIIWIVDRNSLTFPSYIAGLRIRPRGKLLGMIFILSSYGAGLLIEDFTDHLTDTDTHYELYEFQKLQQFALQRESVHRFSSIFTKDEAGFKLNHLGREVFYDKSYILQIAGGEVVDQQNRLVGELNDAVYDSVNSLYYDAKNWCYSQDNYFAELEMIQQRIDFARSCFLVASWTLLMLCIVLVLDRLLIVRFSKKEEYQRTLRNWLAHHQIRLESTDWESPYSENFARNVKKLVLFLLIVMFLGRTGYWHAEEVFNERAFGYHVSARKHGDVKPIVTANPQLSKPNALLWMRTSGEYAVICRQIYGYALQSIKNRSLESDKKLAVVLDLDETVLDNTSFNAKLFMDSAGYSKPRWTNWVAKHSDLVRPIPGAKDFINNLPSNVELIFISNRFELSRAETIATLVRLGLAPRTPSPDDDGFSEYWNSHLLLMPDDCEDPECKSKVKRREELVDYEIVAYIGDNLGDFPVAFDQEKLKWAQRRKAALAESEFGEKWFVLPNPLYGDWSNQLDVNEILKQASE